jgi:thiol-disulfide isomerase/thioredoxin
MNKITLITSEGCLGCQVMKNSIAAALLKTNADITVETIDIKDTDKKLIKRFNITDTPCAIFYKDDKYLFKKIGSVPSVVVVQWINVHYK